MSVFKKPWFIIFVCVLGYYSYKVLRGAGSFGIRTTSALAAADRPSKTVDLTQVMSWPAGTEISFTGFEATDLSVRKVAASQLANSPATTAKSASSQTGDAKVGESKVQIRLTGSGQSYKNDGSQISDWLLIQWKGSNRLVVDSALHPGAKSFEDLLEENSLSLEILVASSETVSSLSFVTVNGDLLADGLNCEKLSAVTVSGDIELKNGQYKKIKVNTVSGDLDSHQLVVETVQVNTVSGDIHLDSPKAPLSVLKVNTVSGDLSVNLPHQSRPEVKFSSLGGSNTQDNFSGASVGVVKFSSLSGDADFKGVQ